MLMLIIYLDKKKIIASKHKGFGNRKCKMIVTLSFTEVDIYRMNEGPRRICAT